MSIRNQVLALFVLLTVLTATVGYLWLKEEIRPRYLEAQEEVMVDIANILASLISQHSVTTTTEIIRDTPQNSFISIFSASPAKTKTVETESIELNPQVIEEALKSLDDMHFTAYVNQLEKTFVDMRVYVTNSQGIVVYDSDNHRGEGADYSEWIDVKRTLDGGYGARLTDDEYFYSEGKTMYVAAPIIVKKDLIGVLSVGKPTKNAEQFIVYLKDNILAGVIVLCVLVIIIGALVSFMITRPLKKLEAYANQLSSGKKVDAPKLGNNEVGAVGAALLNMKNALDGKAYISEYVQNLTHEIKAPVAGIQGAAELLQEDMSEQHRAKFLNNILSQTDRIHLLVNQLLELAKIEALSSLQDIEQVDIVSVVNEAVTNVSTLAQYKHVELQVMAGDPVELKGDRFLLGQAITNILKNAIEYSPENSAVTINVDAEDEHCLIKIADQGAGIPDYALGKVTEKFYSLPKPDGKKGSGLGLSFVREIIELHHGELRFDNYTPTGTAVEIKLPITQ